MIDVAEVRPHRDGGGLTAGGGQRDGVMGVARRRGLTWMAVGWLPVGAATTAVQPGAAGSGLSITKTYA